MIAVSNQRLLLSLCLTAFISGIATTTACADPPSLLKMFRKAPAAKPINSDAYKLSQEDGPWLILASTVVGEGAQQRAERIAKEIRTQMKLPAFIYKENFDFTGTINPGAAKKLRYANRYQYDGYAVLVGEYDSIKHPSIEKDLQRIKTATLPVFQDPNEVAAENNRSNPVMMVKALTAELIQYRKDKPLGPMGQAFVTRNPMLPKDFFQAPPVDAFVHQMNDGLENSLLKCSGKYTVVVKTFEGMGAIMDGKAEKKFTPNSIRLHKYAANAEKMAADLRSKGVEAYQFHDRFRSLVTVGSFEELGRELPDGRFEYDPAILRVMNKYRAFNVRPELARQVPVGTRGMASNNAAMIPFDVQPTPIAVPGSSKTSLYKSALGMR
ncbi:MAG: hypothetical protein AB8B91_17100 [Rubripirellula sp.]